MDRVAIINSVYEYSSTGALTKHLYEYGNSNGFETFVYYGRGKKVVDNHVIRIDSKIEVLVHKILALITGCQGMFSNIATSRLISSLRANGIRKVILLNIHGYYLNEKRLLLYLKTNGINTVYVTPDEYAGLGKCCYAKGCEQYKTECKKCPLKSDYPRSLFFDRANLVFNRKKEVYSGFETMTIMGPESNLALFRESALLAGIPMKRISWGIDLNLYKYEINESLYDKYRIPKDKIIILTVANSSNPRKGVKEYFFEIARRLVNTDYHFVNVGYDGDREMDGVPSNTTTIDYINDQVELAQIYSMADLYLLASTTDTMPLSCLISFACETPVCCFYTSGLKYLASKSSLAIKYCEIIDVDALEHVIRQVNHKTKEEMESCRRLALDEYSIEAFSEKVFEVIRE